VFGFAGSTQRPQPLKFLNSFIKEGKRREMSPADNRDHYISHKDRYHIKESVERTKGKLIEAHGGEGVRRAVWLARYTGQRQADVLRMSKSALEDGGIKVVQQKTGKELWIPLHQDLKEEMRGWQVNPPWTFVQNAKGEPTAPTGSGRLGAKR
jgi:integrase